MPKMTTDLPDVNVLVALVEPDHEFHNSAHEWLESTSDFATTPLSETGLIRVLMTVTTTPAATVHDAIVALRSIRNHRKAIFWPDDSSLADPSSYIDHLTGRKQVTDSQLLNLAISKGGRLVTFDGKIRESLKPSLRKYIVVLK